MSGTVQQVAVNPLLVGEPFVLSRERTKNTEMPTIVLDVFRHFVIHLTQVHHGTVPVPTVGKINDDVLLFCFPHTR